MDDPDPDSGLHTVPHQSGPPRSKCSITNQPFQILVGIQPDCGGMLLQGIGEESDHRMPHTVRTDVIRTLRLGSADRLLQREKIRIIRRIVVDLIEQTLDAQRITGGTVAEQPFPERQKGIHTGRHTGHVIELAHVPVCDIYTNVIVDVLDCRLCVINEDMFEFLERQCDPTL